MSASNIEAIRPAGRLGLTGALLGRAAGGLGLAVSTALLSTWAFPPTGLWWLIWVAWVPMIVAQYVVLPARLSWLAPAVGVGGFYAGYLHGVYDPSFPWWYMVLPVAIAAVVGVATSAWRRTDEASRFRLFVLGFPLAWTAVDFLRGMVPAVATDGYPAYALYREPWLIQPISVLSIHALDFLILLVNWAIAGMVLVALERRRERRLHVEPGQEQSGRMSVRAVLTGVAAVGAALALWTVSSVLMLRNPTPTVRVAALQTTGVESGIDGLGADIAQTREAAAHGARVIVWPEKSLAFDPLVHDSALLATLARDTGAYLVIGYAVQTPEGQRNEATVVSPAGRFLGVYGKQHPAVMFPDDRTSITPGGHPYDTTYGRLATIICYDLDFTDTARAMASQGTQIIGVPSWDPPSDATKHYGILVFRAVENRVSMVKADAGYDSAIIDPYGRIRASTVNIQGAQRTVIADIPVGSGRTPADWLGNWPGWAFVAAFGALVLVRVTRRPRRLFSTKAPQDFGPAGREPVGASR